MHRAWVHWQQGTFLLNALKVAEHPGTAFSGLISYGDPLELTSCSHVHLTNVLVCVYVCRFGPAPKLGAEPFRLWETPFFIVLAIFGGLIGAAFNQINFKVRRGHLGCAVPAM